MTQDISILKQIQRDSYLISFFLLRSMTRSLFSCIILEKDKIMRRAVLSLMLAVSSMVASDISVEVTNIVRENGTIKIGLYKKAENFTSTSKFYKNQTVEIKSNSVKLVFKNIPNGTYAISLFHDENENSKLDKNFLGIPTEGYGFSNNIRHLLRGANFEEASFELNSDKNLSIEMGY